MFIRDEYLLVGVFTRKITDPNIFEGDKGRRYRTGTKKG